MIRWYHAASAPILLWCGTSAHAADVATIDCVGKVLDPATANSISADFQASIEGAQNGLPDIPAQKGGASDPAVQATVDRASARCGDLYGWTPRARAAASDYALKRLALPLFEAAVFKDGLDPGQIARLSKGLNFLPDPDDGSPPGAEKNRGIVAALTLRLLRAGISLQTPQQMRDAYALAMWHVHLDKAQTSFIAA